MMVQSDEEDAEEEEVLTGVLKTISYNELVENVVVIPVNGANVSKLSNLQTELNKIYGQAVTRWNVTMHQGVDYDFGDTFDNDGNDISNYTAHMRRVKRRFGRENSIDNKTYYLFVVPGPTEKPSNQAFMPRKKQSGFLFAENMNNLSAQDWVTVLAHELAHGAFRLEHHANASGQTDNLMDYNRGRFLHKDQWDKIHNPADMVALFQDDAEGAYEGMSDEEVEDYELASSNLENLFVEHYGADIIDSNCFGVAFSRGKELYDQYYHLGTSEAFNIATYGSIIEYGLCETENDNCGQESDYSAFACGFSNAIFQELNWIVLLDLVNQDYSQIPEDFFNCLEDNISIGVTDKEGLEDIFYQCLIGTTPDNIIEGIEDFVVENWDDPYYQGQATVFVISLISPFKAKLVSKVKQLPKFAGKSSKLDFLGIAKNSDELKLLSKIGDDYRTQFLNDFGDNSELLSRLASNDELVDAWKVLEGSSYRTKIGSLELFSDPTVLASRQKIINDGIANLYPNIPVEELTAIRHYTTNAYENLNTALRNGNPNEYFRSFEEMVNNGLSRIQKFDGDKVFRGVKGDEAVLAKTWQVNDNINFKDFKSTSTSSSVANDFAGDVVYEIVNPKGYNVCGISCLPGEAEVLFKSGSNFKVKEIKSDFVVYDSDYNPFTVRKVVLEFIED
jgi:hypothetical protein